MNFVDTVNANARRSKLPTKLRMLRKACGYSQVEDLLEYNDAEVKEESIE